MYRKVKPKVTKKYCKQVFSAIKVYCTETREELRVPSLMEAQYILGLDYSDLFYKALVQLDKEFLIDFRITNSPLLYKINLLF